MPFRANIKYRNLNKAYFIYRKEDVIDETKWVKNTTGGATISFSNNGINIYSYNQTGSIATLTTKDYIDFEHYTYLLIKFSKSEKGISAISLVNEQGTSTTISYSYDSTLNNKNWLCYDVSSLQKQKISFNTTPMNYASNLNIEYILLIEDLFDIY